MSETAPVCLLPNRGQIPPLMAGKLYQQAVPRAQDLPTALAAINVLSQIVQNILLPSLPPFNNNLAPTNFRAAPGMGGGTSTIYRGGGFNTKGSDGKDAENHQWDQTFRLYELVKVVNPDDKEQRVFVKQIVRLDFQERQTEKKFSFTQKGSSGAGAADLPEPSGGDDGGGGDGE